MKHTSIIKKLIIIELIAIFLIFESKVVFATGKIDLTSPSDTRFNGMINIIISIFQVVAVGVGLIMLIALAVKYMVASPSEKAEIKKHAVVYIVGAVIAFSATGIVSIIKDFVEKNVTA